MSYDRKLHFALRVFDNIRNQLIVNHRFLSRAIYGLEPKAIDDEENAIHSWATDGTYFYFSPERMVEQFINSDGSADIIFLHSLLHCMYLHPFFAERHNDKRLWDLACDIFVWDIIYQFGIDTVYSGERRRETDKIERSIKIMSAQSIYRYFRKGLSDGTIEKNDIEPLYRLFSVDDHVLWNGVSRKDGNNSDGKETQEDSSSMSDGKSGSEGHEGRDESGEYGNLAQEKNIDRWRGIAERVEVELSESFSKGKLKGETAGNIIDTLESLDKSDIGYEDFLRKFAVMEERMTVDLDSFDYNYYTYGLNLYGDMPLVEPLEFREMHTIHDFVIAIDTSGSCDDDMVKIFLSRTFEILSENTFADSGLEIYIIQCDASIQNELMIKDSSELKEYVDELKIYGRGGTDFRPVFDRVEEIRRGGGLKNLKGLLYFTDGYGDYPDKPTDYKTAFVFAESDHSERIPPWIMRINIEEGFENT